MTDRIQFRLAVTVYRCLHGTAPEYLSELFVPASTRSSRHCLRSSDSNKLVVAPVNLSTYGRRSFAASGPIVWNSLPEYLREHGRRKRGVCRGSDIPTIYVEGILICISP